MGGGQCGGHGCGRGCGGVGIGIDIISIGRSNGGKIQILREAFKCLTCATFMFIGMFLFICTFSSSSPSVPSSTCSFRKGASVLVSVSFLFSSAVASSSSLSPVTIIIIMIVSRVDGMCSKVGKGLHDGHGDGR